MVQVSPEPRAVASRRKSHEREFITDSRLTRCDGVDASGVKVPKDGINRVASPAFHWSASRNYPCFLSLSTYLSLCDMHRPRLSTERRHSQNFAVPLSPLTGAMPRVLGIRSSQMSPEETVPARTVRLGSRGVDGKSGGGAQALQKDG